MLSDELHRFLNEITKVISDLYCKFVNKMYLEPQKVSVKGWRSNKKNEIKNIYKSLVMISLLLFSLFVTPLLFSLL